MRLGWVLLGMLLLAGEIGAPVFAQDDGGLVTESVRLTTQVDAFGAEQTVAVGRLVNSGTDAYTNLIVYAEAYDSAGEMVGEGVGFAVTACGIGLLPDFTLQPAQSVRFSALIELFEDGAAVERVEVLPEGEAVPAEPINPFLSYSDLIPVATGDIVAVEWADYVEQRSDTLRYGAGCDHEIFSEHEWYSYATADGTVETITHPNSDMLTERFLEITDLEDPVILARSFLTPHPYDRRVVYQDAINVLYTIEPDGTFKRTLGINLSRFSLQGYNWLPNGRLVAYYFGAYGDPVRYVTASTLGQRISAPIDDIVPSYTVPGATADGARVVITATIDGVTGYYFQSTTTSLTRLLFEAEPPGNNYPAPVYVERDAGTANIFIVRPVDNQTRLQCFDTTDMVLRDLTILPLNLTTEDRAWMSISPDRRYLAIHANGLQGGLWLYDLYAAPFCATPDPLTPAGE